MNSVIRNDENKVTLDDSNHPDEIHANKKGPILGDVSNLHILNTNSQISRARYADDVKPVMNTTLVNSYKYIQKSIDNQESYNPQNVSDYASDIVHYWLLNESKYCVSPNYMIHQSQISTKMREILIDWLTAVMEKFRLQHETLYLCINILDRYLEKVVVSKSKLQLVGITALLIASKYEEIYYPQLKDFSYITDMAYTVDQIREMEISIMNTLQFEITIPTTNKFLLRYVKVCKDNEYIAPMANYIAQRSLQNYSMLKYLPSTKAAAAVFLARKYLKVTPSWSNLLERFTEMSVDSISTCAKEMDEMIHSNSKYDGVKNCYSKQKYLRVATLVPTTTVF